jgi:hypothetical protein
LFGEKFDPSDLAPQFVEYFESGERIKVETDHGEWRNIRTGTISVTTGWRPAFLLIHRRNSDGSSDVLGARDRVTHVQYGKAYRPVACEDCGCNV